VGKFDPTLSVKTGEVLFGTKECEERLFSIVKEHCDDLGRWVKNHTVSQYYDQKEKLYGPSTDVLLADRIRRGKKIDTSFHLTGKPYRGDYEDEETPWWQKD
jgi:hypothetical protein